jgi:teichuronic acid biosynthesis glycosyltransferase TuaC
MRILTLTNMYPTGEDPTYGTFVADQVIALRQSPRVDACEVMFINGRSSRVNYLRGAARLRRALNRRPADVIHAHYGLTGAVAVTQRRVPVVVTYHSGDLELSRWQRAISRQAYRLAADNICVSRRAMTKLPGPAHHVMCGVDTNLFAPRDRAVARAALGLGADELAVLFPSSPDRPKKAYHRFADVVDELRRRGHRVHELHLRGLTRQEVPEMMAAADVMVLTSTQEGAPVAIMEAMACGLGVVATPVGEVPAILEAARSAYVAAFDVGAFAAAAERLAAVDPPLRRADPECYRFATNDLTARLIAILDDASTRCQPSGVSVVCA